MTLLTPLFLLGAAAIALPLWLHLLQRDNPIRLPFSSLMFFEKRKQSTFLQKKFRYLLLLASRLALFLLLVLAFSKPIWERPPTTAVSDIPALHLIVIDTSMSMNFGNRWDQALVAARSVVDGLDSADQAQIIANGPSVSVVTERTRDQVALRAALDGLSPKSSRNSYGDVVEAVRSLAPDSEIPVEVHLISDFQNSALPGRFSDLTLPTAAALHVHNVAGADDRNWAIESVRGSLKLHGAEKTRLEVTVAGFSPEAERKTLALTINGANVGSLSQEVPAMGRTSFVFEDFEAPNGFSRAELTLTPNDDLPADDLRLVALDNTEPEPILFITGDRRGRDALYYQSALAASSASAFQVKVSSSGEAERLDPGEFAMVVSSDIAQLGTGFEAKLQDYVEEGGAVLIAAGQQIASRGSFPLTGNRAAASPLERGGAFRQAGHIDVSHDVLRQVEGFRGVKFFRYVRVAPEEGDEVLGQVADGSPLLVERRIGQGRVLLFASALDNVWNDLPLHPVFVPFVAESARYLSGAGDEDRVYFVDSSLELRRGRAAGSAVQVFDPNGDRALSLAQSTESRDVPLSEVGFYEIRGSGGTELVAVNPDPRESNLRSVDDDTLELWQSTGRGSEAVGSESGEPSSIKPPPIRLWRLLLFLLAAVVLLESVLGNRHLSVRREV